MSFSHADVSNQVRDISNIVKMVEGCSLITGRTTNKRAFIVCSGRSVANTMLLNLKYNGYPIAESAIGLKTDRYYVCVYFNYPF